MSELKCLSIKKRGSNEQCSNKRKLNSNYCGKHVNQKVIINYTFSNNINNTNNTNDMNIDEKIDFMRKIKKIDEIDEVIDNSNKEINIIKCQSIIRRFLVIRKKKCINDEDFFTLENKYLIPDKYFISITDENNYTYCFDIRSLNKLLETSKLNPYTSKPFTSKNLTKINNKISSLRASESSDTISYNFISGLSDEQIFESCMIEIFHKFDMLDNYTDYKWFANLSLRELKLLYFNLEKLWNYRSQLSHNQKCRIIHSGIAFNIPHARINRISNIKHLQKILLDEFNRFASEGVDINEKKLGVMLILTCLVEVSYNAAISLPHLRQY